MQRKKISPLLVHGIVILIILLLAFAPVISVMVASEIANANGCQLDEGSVHPCIVNGVDQGETLYTLGMMGWFMLATLPLGLGAIVLYLIFVAGYYLIRRASRARA